MDREYGTERLADASFLEELLRGRRTLVIASGDDAPAQHLLKRLGRGVDVVEARGGTIARPDRSADAVIALGAFQEIEAIDRLIAEARRVLSPGGLFAASWVDPARQTLDTPPGAGNRAALAPADAQRRLQGKFGWIAIVARQPYLGFQFLSGVDNQGAVALDTSLGGAETPSGYLALAADQALPLTDLLVQVPYDRAVERVRQWLRSVERPAEAAPQGRGSAVARPRDTGTESDRLRSEVASLRDRAQGAVEEADRARGEARAARERVALLEAEVSKLRARLKGAPDPEAEKLRADLEARTRERDAARRDAEGAAGESVRALEAAAQYEREVDHLTNKVQALERELAAEKKAKEKAVADLSKALKERERLTKELEGAKVERDRVAGELSSAGKELVAAAEKRAADSVRRNEQTLKRLQDAEKRVSELEEAKSAAERSAEDAWKRVKEAQVAAPPAADMVPESDLQAAQSALASAIQRAEEAERERRRLIEQGQKANPEEIKALKAELADSRRELDAARARTDDADVEGLKSRLHQRDTALTEARERVDSAEQRSERFATETAEALAKLKAIEETLAMRDAELKRALGALDGVETREARDKELLAELKGEVARLTEALAAANEEGAREREAPSQTAELQERDREMRKELEAAASEAARAQAEAARVHAELDALREEFAASKKELEELRSTTSKGDSQADEREKRIAELEAKLLEGGSKREVTGDIERRSVAMAQKMAMLEAELERAKDDVKQATAEARKYRALAEAIEPPLDRKA